MIIDIALGILLAVFLLALLPLVLYAVVIIVGFVLAVYAVILLAWVAINHTVFFVTVVVPLAALLLWDARQKQVQRRGSVS